MGGRERVDAMKWSGSEGGRVGVMKWEGESGCDEVGEWV